MDDLKVVSVSMKYCIFMMHFTMSIPERAHKLILLQQNWFRKGRYSTKTIIVAQMFSLAKTVLLLRTSVLLRNIKCRSWSSFSSKVTIMQTTVCFDQLVFSTRCLHACRLVVYGWVTHVTTTPQGHCTKHDAEAIRFPLPYVRRQCFNWNYSADCGANVTLADAVRTEPALLAGDMLLFVSTMNNILNIGTTAQYLLLAYALFLVRQIIPGIWLF